MIKHIILVGPMGAGKSTVGRILASKLNQSFVDTDRLIEERAGADIPWIFDVEGEEGFRERETNTLSQLSTLSEPHIVATGGGVVLRDANRQLLKSLGTVFYLTAPLDQLVARTSKDRKRPLLQVANPKQKIEELIHARDPLYLSVADEVINTDGKSSKWVAQKISDILA